MPVSNGRGSSGRPPVESSGEPGYPVTVVDHDLRSGGRITFFMTGTEGDRHDSTWVVVATVRPATSSYTMPTSTTTATEGREHDDSNDHHHRRARWRENFVMAIRTQFNSQAGMEEVLAMGVEEGACAPSSHRSTQSWPAGPAVTRCPRRPGANGPPKGMPNCPHNARGYAHPGVALIAG